MISSIARTVRLLLACVVAVGFMDFAIVNRDVVSVSLFPFPYSADMPKFLFAMICFAMGAVVAGLLINIRLSKTKWKLSAAQKRIMALENELKAVEAKNPEMLPVALHRKA